MPASTSTQPLTTEQHTAYRRLALTILGADVQTLLAQLLERDEMSQTLLPATSVRMTTPETRAA
jgi:hypothetical protein